MSLDVSCKVCGRKIVNLATSHLCQDGSYVGPVCKSRLDGGGSIEIPTLESLVLSESEAQAISKKIHLANYDLSGKDSLKASEQMYKEQRNTPWDPYAGPILEAPAHPNAIASINIHELMKFNKILEDGETNPKGGYEEITEDHVARAVHCFLKLFKDPNLNREQLDLYNKKLGLKLIGVAPNTIHDEKHSDFSNFVITSTKSPCPERALMIKVSSAGWVNFRCLNLTGNDVEASYLSKCSMLVPMASRRSNGCSSFQLISAFVVSVFMLDNPEESEAFRKVYPMWRELKSISSNNHFAFHIPDSSRDDDQE